MRGNLQPKLTATDIGLLNVMATCSVGLALLSTMSNQFQPNVVEHRQSLSALSSLAYEQGSHVLKTFIKPGRTNAR